MRVRVAVGDEPGVNVFDLQRAVFCECSGHQILDSKPGLRISLPRRPLGLDTAPGGFVSTLMGGFVWQMLVGEAFGARVMR